MIPIGMWALYKYWASAGKLTSTIGCITLCWSRCYRVCWLLTERIHDCRTAVKYLDKHGVRTTWNVQIMTEEWIPSEMFWFCSFTATCTSEVVATKILIWAQSQQKTPSGVHSYKKCPQYSHGFEHIIMTWKHSKFPALCFLAQSPIPVTWHVRRAEALWVLFSNEIDSWGWNRRHFRFIRWAKCSESLTLPSKFSIWYSGDLPMRSPALLIHWASDFLKSLYGLTPEQISIGTTVFNTTFSLCGILGRRSRAQWGNHMSMCLHTSEECDFLLSRGSNFAHPVRHPHNSGVQG